MISGKHIVTIVTAAKQVELVCKTYHLAKRNLSFRRPKQVVLQMQPFLMNIFNIKRGDKRQENDVLKMFVTQCYTLTISGLNINACCIWQQATTLNLLKISSMCADGLRTLVDAEAEVGSYGHQVGEDV